MNLVLAAALLLLPVWGISSWAWGLLNNYRAAKTSGLPLVISPFNPNNVSVFTRVDIVRYRSYPDLDSKIVYMIFKVPLRSTIEKLVPLPGVKLSIFGWEFLYKYAPHEQHGKSFILVTPGQNELWCSDPAMARVILTRRKDFVAPPIVSKIMGFQGDNVISVSLLLSYLSEKGISVSHTKACAVHWRQLGSATTPCRAESQRASQ